MQKGSQLALKDGDKWPSAAGHIVWLVHTSDGWFKVWAEHAEAIEKGIAENRNPVACNHTIYAENGQKTMNYKYDWKASPMTRGDKWGTKCTLIRARYYPEPPNPPSAAGGPQAGGAAEGWGSKSWKGWGSAWHPDAGGAAGGGWNKWSASGASGSGAAWGSAAGGDGAAADGAANDPSYQ